MQRKRAEQGGFLLLEALVAFVIAALALAVLYHGAVGGLRTTSIAGRYEQAVARARSRLAAIGGRAGSPVPGIEGGDDGSGFTWKTQVVPLAAENLAGPAGPAAARLVLYQVSVTVSWQGDGGRRQVELVSARVAKQAPGP